MDSGLGSGEHDDYVSSFEIYQAKSDLVKIFKELTKQWEKNKCQLKNQLSAFGQFEFWIPF